MPILNPHRDGGGFLCLRRESCQNPAIFINIDKGVLGIDRGDIIHGN